MHGSATDTQDGTLPNSALSWEVIKHHDTHVHPFLPPTTGNASQASSSHSTCNLAKSQVRMPSLARISFQA